MNNLQNNNDFLVVIDIQPGYSNACADILDDVIDKMNNTKQRIIFFYVGLELDLDSKDDVIYFLIENGLNEDVIEQINFIEKDYGFFRPWMDNNIDHNIILNAIKIMHNESIYDSRDFEENHWQKLLLDQNIDVEFLLTEPIFYPNFDISLFSNNFIDGFELIGGGRYECLGEINLYLEALDKKTYINETLCYGNTTLDIQPDIPKKNKLK